MEIKHSLPNELLWELISALPLQLGHWRELKISGRFNALLSKRMNDEIMANYETVNLVIPIS